MTQMTFKNKWKKHLVLLPGFTNRWALAWEHAPDCNLIEDAGPQSKEWPSRLHILTYSRIHDNTTGLCHWIFDWQTSKCQPLPLRYTVQAFCILMSETSVASVYKNAHTESISSISGSQVTHTFWWSVCICFYFDLNWHHAWLSARSFT